MASDPIIVEEKPRLQLASEVLIRRVHDFCAAGDAATRQDTCLDLVRSIRPGSQLLQVVEYLEADADTRALFRARFAELLGELRYVALFAETGIPSDHGLAEQTIRRLVSKFFPMARHSSDAAKLLTRMYGSGEDAERFAELPPDLFERLLAAICDDQDHHAAQTAAQCGSEVESRPVEGLREALRLLASRVSWLGLKPEMRDRSLQDRVSDSPFYQLPASTERLLGPPGELAQGAVSEWQALLGRCRQEMGAVHSAMEQAGVSVELVFDMQKIECCLTRMESLVAVLFSERGTAATRAIRGLLLTLIKGRYDDRSLANLLRENLDLLARKTVEHTGRSGEHYIAHDRSEYRHMWLAAIGGGLLTVFTAAIKLRVTEAHFAPFMEGFLAGTNYAVSFVLLQMFGLVLATKQPAATAATFAGIVRDNRGEQRSSKIADFVSHITSTQLAAAIGNVAAVTIGALGFEKLWELLFARTYLPEEGATYVYRSLHPFESNTALYAIITGIILWLAALAGGWCENFANYYRIPDAVAQHPLGARFGTARLDRWADALRHNLGGWSTSIILGYLLGFAPVFGHFFGLPLDVRHVTLSTGTLALAAARYGTASLGRAWLYSAVGGIAVVFVLNLTVSFTIACAVALMAYNVDFHEQLEILRFLVREGLRAPWKFILPPRDPQQGA
jgi:site-specific recombinase